MTRDEFLLRVQRICFDIESLTVEYGSNKVISLVVLGCVDTNKEGLQTMSTLYNYNIEDRDELNAIINFVDSTWREEDPNKTQGYKDLDDLLDGTGIDLE